MDRFLAVDIESQGFEGRLLGGCIVGEGIEECHEASTLLPRLIELSEEGYKFVAHHAATEHRIFKREGFNPGTMACTMILAHYLNPHLRSFGLRACAKREECDTQKQDFKPDDWETAEWTPEMQDYCLDDTRACWQLFQKYTTQLENWEFEYLWYTSFEVAPIIDKMSRNGLYIDISACQGALGPLKQEYEHLYDNFDFPEFIAKGTRVLKKFKGNRYEVSGGYCLYEGKNPEGMHVYRNYVPFERTNANHLAVLLQEQGWEPTEFGKSGRPLLNQDVILWLDHDRFPLAKILSRQRALEFMIQVLEKLSAVDEKGRVYPSYSQTTTLTGRFSSFGALNSQNIPSRSEEAYLIRQCIAAPPGKVLVTADLSNIEARILAHWLCVYGYPDLAYDFAAGVDFHSKNAANWVIPLFQQMGIDNPKLARNIAKTALFASIYGAGPDVIYKKANISAGKKVFDRSFGEQILKLMDESMPLSRMKQDIIREARANGGVFFDHLGRRMYYPSLFYKDSFLRGEGERQLINAVFQGGASGIVKVIMNELDPDAERLHADIIIQVHDSLTYETPIETSEEFSAIMNKVMNRHDELLVNCPIAAEVKIISSMSEEK
jgi:DNA polymerase I-like protein with 3'-5' exonuclease and polymerase domains